METVMEEKIIEVGMAEMKVAQAPASLVTRALGSCLGITLYDALRKTGAMVHVMLPDIDKAKIRSNPNRFVNSAIWKMVQDLEKNGCSKVNLAAKVFGGAQMFSFIAADSILNIGQKNIEMAKQIFTEAGIKISAEETGGTFGRTITLNLENGKVTVETVSWGKKEV